MYHGRRFATPGGALKEEYALSNETKAASRGCPSLKKARRGGKLSRLTKKGKAMAPAH